jgi:adenylate cyclase
MSSIDTVQAAFADEQRKGLTVALQGRLAILIVIAIWIGATRFPPTLYMILALIALFAVLGAAQLWLVKRRGVEAWPIYLLVLGETSILATAMIMSGPATRDMPIPISYRFDQFPYFFLLIASAAFSYSPRLVLWSGLSVAITWAIGGFIVRGTHDGLVTWGDIPPDASGEMFMQTFLSPNFFAIGSRVQEILIVLSVSGLLALVAWRARRVVVRQAEAERERASIAETFGKYVPEEIARGLIADHGAFKPQQRTATVMFTDIEGFTSLAETMDPAEVLLMLDDYFDALGARISAEGGVVGQFQGDALIATFNVPVPNENHAAAALRAGLAIQDAMARESFRGKTLRTRIGLNTGPVVSGSVGSRGRRSYTVYGDVVNAAARIEALNKEFGTTMLAAEATIEAAGAGFEVEEVARRTMRGRSDPTTLFAITAPPSLT